MHGQEIKQHVVLLLDLYCAFMAWMVASGYRLTAVQPTTYGVHYVEMPLFLFPFLSFFQALDVLARNMIPI